MSEVFRTFAQLTGVIAVSTMFMTVIALCYLVLAVFLLGPLRVLSGALLAAEGAVGRGASAVGGGMLRFCDRVEGWRVRRTSIAATPDGRDASAESEGGNTFMGILLDTVVFLVAMAATLLLLIISANLLGLDRWTGADAALPWLIGLSVVLVSAYAWSRIWHSGGRRRDKVLAGVVFALAGIAFLILATLRGIDVWIQQINEDNTVRAVAEGTAVAPPPPFLLDLRAALPAMTYFFAELAIIFGAALAHRGMFGIVGLAVALATLVLQGLVLLAVLAVRLLGLVLQVVLRVLAVALDVITYPAAAVYRWLLRYDRIRGALRLRALPGDSIEERIDGRRPGDDASDGARAEPTSEVADIPAEEAALAGQPPPPLRPVEADGWTRPSAERARDEVATNGGNGAAEQEVAAARTIEGVRGRLPE